MTQEDSLEGFKHLLDIRKYPYKEEEGILIITGHSNVDLQDVNYIPKNICFSNEGFVHLEKLILPENTVFRNGGNIFLNDLMGLSKGVRFENYNYFLYANIFYFLTRVTIPEISPQRVINCYIKQIYG
jgi:hypothetical protein